MTKQEEIREGMNNTDLEAHSEQQPLKEMPNNYIPIELFNEWYEPLLEEGK